MEKVWHFSWFYEQFTMANGLEWLSCVGLSDPWSCSIILRLLVDQIIFETATPHLHTALECSYICLQTLRGARFLPLVLDDDRSMDSRLMVRGDELANLRKTLIWVFQTATKTRSEDGPHELSKEPELDNLPFATIAHQKVQMHGLASPGQVRSFEFTRGMSNEEWEEWSTRIKTMIMGVRLGGLGCGPVYAVHRFVRDPDGTCGATCSA
jgi:hypothetical protein